MLRVSEWNYSWCDLFSTFRLEATRLLIGEKGRIAGQVRKSATILDNIKWNSKPPSAQIKDEAARRPKTRHFPILDFGGGGGGRGGLGFPFILSKIVASKLSNSPPSMY